MLQLVLGIAGSGKTSWALKQMAQRAGQGKRSLLLVPDQFSASAEALVFAQLGAHNSAFVEVVSFRTLAERIFQQAGAPLQAVLDDAARVVYVRRALNAVAQDMHTYARQRASTAFCSSCADVLNEFKTAGATPQQVREIGRKAGQDKLVELALVFEAYEAIIAKTALDPQDKLELAAQKAGCGYFTGKACYIDNFDGFTAPECKMIEAMLAYAESLQVLLCCNHLAETENGLGLFSPVRKTAARLLAQAAKIQVPSLVPVELPYTGAQASASAVMNLLLTEGAAFNSEVAVQGLTLTNPPDEWEEMRQIAAQMRRLAMQGESYSRMAVICRDISAYEAAARRAFAMYDIPYFTDAVSTLEYTAPVTFLRAALGVLRRGVNGDAILGLLKTGLCGYSAQQIAALENYVFTWAPLTAEWQQPFTKNPEGLLQQLTPQAEQQLSLAEQMRADITPKLAAFSRRCRGANASELTRQLYLLMQTFQAQQNNEQLAARLEQAAALEAADECRRAWDATIGLLDTLYTLLDGESYSATEYDEMLLLLVRATDFGSVPQTLECAVLTAADRMRLGWVEHAFVVGLCEGEFPMQIGYSGLLTHADRDLLVAGGVEMPGGFENRVLLEDMIFYRALTSAKNKLYLSWPQSRGGVGCTLTSALATVTQRFNLPALTLPLADMAATPAAAFDLLGMQYRENTTQAATLQQALQQAQTGQPLQKLGRAEPRSAVRLHKTAELGRLLGSKLTLSATRAERYYSCPFAYFMERIVNVRPRRKAEFSPLESGTFVHYLLEKVMREAGEAFAGKSDEQLHSMATGYAKAFLEENLPEQTRREEALLANIIQAAYKLLCYLRDGAKQSDFLTDAVELEIADEGDIPPLTLQLPGGQTVKVVGKIDRVDTFQQDGKTYVSIVDYKTGNKKFDLADVYCGLNIQMMLYMHTLQQNGTARYPNAQMAGVMYLTGDPAPASGRREAAGQKAYSMDGILLEEPAVLTALDKSGQGLYLPVKHKQGKARSSKKLANAQKLGQIALHVEQLMKDMAGGVYSGVFDAVPLVHGTKTPCAYCAYRAACRHEDGRDERQVQAPTDAFEIEKETGLQIEQ